MLLRSKLSHVWDKYINKPYLLVSRYDLNAQPT